jgi:hypothetical protein
VVELRYCCLRAIKVFRSSPIELDLPFSAFVAEVLPNVVHLDELIVEAKVAPTINHVLKDADSTLCRKE